MKKIIALFCVTSVTCLALAGCWLGPQTPSLATVPDVPSVVPSTGQEINVELQKDKERVAPSQ